MKWVSTFYNEKVESEMLKFPVDILANFLHIVEMIEGLGLNLGKPYMGSLGSGLYEIRGKGKEGISVIDPTRNLKVISIEMAFVCCL